MSGTNILDELKNRNFDRSELSFEEETVSMSVAMSYLGNAQTELDNVRRLLDVADVVTDTDFVGRSVINATRYDIFMMESCARFALAGSGRDYSKVIPNINNSIGKRLSMEGFKDFMDGIWKAIQAGLKKAWEWIKGFFYHLFGTIPSQRRDIKDVREKANKAVNEYRWEPATSVGSEANVLVRNGKFPKIPSQLLEGMDALVEQTDFFLGDYIGNAEIIFKNVSHLMSQMDSDDNGAVLAKINQEVAGFTFRQLPKHLTTKLITYPQAEDGKRVMEFSPLFNNKSIYTSFHVGQPPKMDLTETERASEVAAYIQSCYMFVENTTPEVRNFSGENTTTPSPHDIVKLCDDMLLLCDFVETFQRGSYYEAIERSKDELERVTNNLVHELHDNPRNGQNSDNLRAAIKYNSYLTMALVQPCANLASIALSSNRAMLLLCKRVVNQ